MSEKITDFQIVQELKKKHDFEIFKNDFERLLIEKRNRIIYFLTIRNPNLFKRHGDDCLYLALKYSANNPKLASLADYLFSLKAGVDYKFLTAEMIMFLVRNSKYHYINSKIPHFLVGLKDEEFMKLNFDDIVEFLSNSIYLQKNKVGFLLQHHQNKNFQVVVKNTLLHSKDLSLIEKAFLCSSEPIKGLLHSHYKDVDVVNFFLENGLNVNEVNEKNENLLTYFFHKKVEDHDLQPNEDDLKMLNLNLYFGAKTDLTNTDNKTVFDYGIYCGENVFKSLLNNADIKNPVVLQRLKMLQSFVDNEYPYNPLIRITKVKNYLEIFFERLELLGGLKEMNERTVLINTAKSAISNSGKNKEQTSTDIQKENILENKFL